VNVCLIASIRSVVLLLLVAGGLVPYGWSQPAVAQVTAGGWTVIEAPGPAARWDHTLAADPATGSLLLFGGRDAAGAPLGDS
jgi:hypothetical protein